MRIATLPDPVGEGEAGLLGGVLPVVSLGRGETDLEAAGLHAGIVHTRVWAYNGAGPSASMIRDIFRSLSWLECWPPFETPGGNRVQRAPEARKRPAASTGAGDMASHDPQMRPMQFGGVVQPLRLGAVNCAPSGGSITVPICGLPATRKTHRNWRSLSDTCQGQSGVTQAPLGEISGAPFAKGSDDTGRTSGESDRSSPSP